MVVRLRLARGRGNRHKVRTSRVFVLAFAALLQPIAVMAGVLAFWRFGADLQWTSEFAISNGLLSHWQVWLAIFLGVELLLITLNRWARRPAVEGQAHAASPAAPPLVKSEL